MIERFKAAFGRALPELPKKELSWRLHFIMGALSYTLAGTDALRLIAELTPAETGNDEALLQRLAPFLLAGLQSPVPDLRREGVRRCFTRPLDLLAPCSSPRWSLRLRQRLGRARSPPPSPLRSASRGSRTRSPAGRRSLLTLAFVLLAIPAERAGAAAQARERRGARALPQADAADVADRTRRDRGRHRLVGRRALLRPAGLAAAARHAGAGAHRRRSSTSSTTTSRSSARW